jgi:hypothetical protein
MTTRSAAAVAFLFLAPPVAQAAEPRAEEQPVAPSQIPAPALQTLDSNAGTHRVHGYTERTFPSGGQTYLVRYHTLTTGDTQVEVTSKGNVVGIYRRLEEPSGTGP